MQVYFFPLLSSPFSCNILTQSSLHKRVYLLEFIETKIIHFQRCTVFFDGSCDIHWCSIRHMCLDQQLDFNMCAINLHEMIDDLVHQAPHIFHNPGIIQGSCHGKVSVLWLRWHDGGLHWRYINGC